MSRNINNNVSGISLEDHNNLKLTISVMRVGQKVYVETFNWGYVGGAAPLKDTLFGLPGYNNTRYKKDFNGTQREKINGGDSVADFDITLLYKLFQMVCGLREASHADWVTESSDSLEFCLYVLKTKRNDVAHEMTRLRPEDLAKRLDELKRLLTKTLKKAGERFGVDAAAVTALQDAVEVQIDAVRDAPIPPATMAEYEEERRANERACILEEGAEEVARLAQVVSLVDVAGYKVDVARIFTCPKLRRDETQILQRQLTVAESYVGVGSVLSARECGEEEMPHVVLLSALSGMGKSTILKFVVDRSVSDRSVIAGLDRFDIVLYFQCQNAEFSSLSQFLALLLPRTSAKYQSNDFQQQVFTLNVLLLLDDLESLSPKSFEVLEEFLRLMSPASRVVATSAREKSKEIQKRVVAQHKRVLFLEVEGIPDDEMSQHVWKVMQHGIRNAGFDRDTESNLHSLISAKWPCLQDHLRSPEILNAISVCWSFYPDRLNDSTTVTEIFILIQDLISQKVLQNITRSILPSIITKTMVKSKLSGFLETLSRVAAKSLVRGSSVIEQKDLMKLIRKCKKLELEEEPPISAFLNYSHEQADALFNYSRNVTFPQRSTMQYYAARFVTRHCARHHTAIREVLQLQPHSIGDANGHNFQSMVKYLLGLLAVHLPTRLKERAAEIVSLLKETGVKKASQWLQYIDEAKGEATITEEVLKEMGDSWEVEDFAVSSTLVSLLRKKPPRRLTVTVCESPSNFPHLKDVLRICAETRGLTLSLHLYKHFWSEKTDTSDEYLDLLLGSSCHLEHFAGRLSASAILRLPSSLQRLALHVTPEMVAPLNQATATMSDLNMLYLNFDASPDAPLAEVPLLRLPNESTVLAVDLWKVQEANVEWACRVARALSPSFGRLVLRGSSLDLSGCRKWIEGLRQLEVTASGVVVGSTEAMTAEGLRELEQVAETVGCSKFTWLKV